MARVNRSNPHIPNKTMEVFQDRLLASQMRISEKGYPIGSCGHELKGRPLFMVGKYDICFDCFLKDPKHSPNLVSQGDKAL